jgi:mRNA interferase MazF
MPDSGDVVTLEFRGARGIARRPAVVVSSATYHQHRPDIIVGVLTTNLQAATAPTDVIIQDWQAASLRQPSAFRCYLNTVLPADVRVIGRLSARDWAGVQQCLSRALAVSGQQ